MADQLMSYWGASTVWGYGPWGGLGAWNGYGLSWRMRHASMRIAERHG
jgi:hypothetical protein